VQGEYAQPGCSIAGIMTGSQNWLLLSPRVKRAQSDWWATVTLGCPIWSCIDWIEDRTNQYNCNDTLVVSRLRVFKTSSEKH
jgi:hypothetical protein